MKILTIKSETKLSEIQNAFQDCYPNLQIKFFENWHEAHEASPKEEKLPNTLTIGKLNPTIKNDLINMSSDLTVRNLESEFEERDLHVQVFRKEGNEWIQTTIKDDDTLENVNKESK